MRLTNGWSSAVPDWLEFRNPLRIVRIATADVMLMVVMVGLGLFGAIRPIQAQTLEVRSGEHASFTRLVLRLPNGADWRLQQDGADARLFVAGERIVFDVTGVFARIPRERLSELNQDGPGKPLQLDLACNCPVKAFVEQGEYVVLDIGNPISDVPIRFGLSEPETEKSAESRGQSRAAAMVLPLIGTDPAAQLLMRNQGAHNSAGQFVLHDPDAPRAPDRDSPPDNNGSTDLSGAQRALQDQIARAATQGLVDVDHDSLRDIEAQSKEPDDLPSIQSSTNIRATTSVDRDMSLAPGLLFSAGSDAYCLDVDRINVTGWGDDRPFGHQVGAYRMRMAGEFDDLSPKDMLGLAKTYLYFGFGAEARQLLREADNSDPDVQLLDAFAQLLDQGQLKKPHPFDDQRHCDSAAAMWSVYANPISPRDEVNSGAVVRAFVELPPHLRAHIGPGLMRRFVNAGDVDSAEILKRIINRASPQEDALMQMAEAELALLNGEQAEADELVKDVAHGGSGESPAALVTLVDRHFASRKPVPNDTIQLLSSYVLEMRRTEVGAELSRAYALALGLAGDFHAAISAAKDLDKPAAEKTVGQLLDVLTDNADEVTFLELAFETAVAQPSAVPMETKMKVARRFLELGFPETALALLDHPAPGSMQEEQAILRAEASLAMGLPRRALLELVGRDGPEIDQLRAEALRTSGLHAEAAEIFTAIESPEEAARSEWLAGLPIESSSNDTTAFSERQEASQRLANLPPASGENTLSGARTLLDQAEALRKDVSLLNSGSSLEGQ